MTSLLVSGVVTDIVRVRLAQVERTRRGACRYAARFPSERLAVSNLRMVVVELEHADLLLNRMSY
jgi:hypothetical protein